MPKYPIVTLQTGSNCVAYSMAYAIEHVLSNLPEEYHKVIDRAELTKLIGAPASVTRSVQIIEQHYPWIKFEPLCPDFITTPIRERLPLVVSTWRDGFTHSVVLLDYRNEYDPAIGEIRPTYKREKMAEAYMPTLRENWKPPIVNRWRKFLLYRLFERLFGYYP